MDFKIRLSILFFIILSLTQLVSAQKTKEETKTFELSKDGVLFVDTYKGSINVETWDKAEVYVHSKIEADTDGWSNSDPEDQIESVKIKYEASNNSLHIQSKYDKTSFFFGSDNKALVHYYIKMPKTARLEIDDYKSKTKIDNLEADIKMETYKGSVEVTGLKGGIKLDTYKGDANIDFDEIKNVCSIDTYKGNIELVLPSSSKFNLDLELGRRGGFKSDFDYSINGRKDDEEVHAKINGGGPEIEFETNKGDLRISKK